MSRRRHRNGTYIKEEGKGDGTSLPGKAEGSHADGVLFAVCRDLVAGQAGEH
jgi:hypothetical protein